MLYTIVIYSAAGSNPFSGVPQTAKKVIQDPDIMPGDAKFLEKFRFQVMADLVGVNAIN